MNQSAAGFFSSMKDKKVLFLGTGISNIELIYRFLKEGADVTVCDCRTRESMGKLADDLESAGAKLKLGALYMSDLEGDIIFRTPGISFNEPALTAARGRGIVVTSEMEMFFDLCPAKIIAVTGSDGKTTTSTLIAKMLEAAGKTVYLGGNIGKPLLPLIDEIKEDDYVVAELSSFQLLSMRRGPDIAVLTNIAPNHLDVHKNMDEYINAKKNIFLHQNAFSKTVFNANDKISGGFAAEARGQALQFSNTGAVENGAYLGIEGNIYMSHGADIVKVMNKSDIRLLGAHNIDNYLAAISAVWGLVPADDILKVAREFNGVEHRIEFVRELDGVKYYNDSIATSPTRAVAGLNAFSEKCILICGGYDKHIPFDAMADTVCNKVKVMITMGVTADKIEAAVKNSPLYSENELTILRADSMESAVTLASETAKSGDVVTLSPACASFDKYPNFEARGRHFKELVHSL